jgi:hypothetical protein
LLAALLVLVRILRILAHRLLPWGPPQQAANAPRPAIVPPASQSWSGYQQRHEPNFRQRRIRRFSQAAVDARAHTRL